MSTNTKPTRSYKRKTTSPPPPPHFITKLRSNLPRRRRHILSPIFLQRQNNNTDRGRTNPAVSFSVSANSTLDEVSCNATREYSNDAFRRVTRSYAKQKEIERAEKWTNLAGEDELPETSCVESCSIADSEVKPVRNGVVAAAPNSASTIEQSKAKKSGDSILACSESFSDEEEDEEYTSSALSEFQSEALADELEADFLSDTSMWTDNSGSQFSQQSEGDSTASPCFALFKEYSKQFTRFSSQSSAVDEFADEFVYWRFENEDDEQSYQRLRGRERKRGSKINDYVAVYAYNTDYGVLVNEQRLLMINWIVETSDVNELHNETKFLAVRLLDRFLSKGFFKSRRNLNIVGIACLTLATRIEENQPYNCVLQKIFHVREDVYGRTEVVAMEWLVQKELEFQCFSPTIYNFLWFYLKAAAADEEMEDLARRLTEYVIFDHKQLQFWPSSVAAGIVMLVSLAAKQDESCLRVMEAHVRTSIDDLPECIKSLEWLVKYT